jgi:hypothetical protein
MKLGSYARRMPDPTEPRLLGDDEDEDDGARWAAATQQAAVLAERGPVVVGVSLQAAWFGLSLIDVAIVLIDLPLRSGPWEAVVSGAGSMVALVGWLVARHRRSLEPFVASGERSPLSFLAPHQRRATRSQIRGKIPPTRRSAELVGLLIRRQEQYARNTWLSLVGFAISCAGVDLRRGWGLLVVLLGSIVVAVISVIERRRWRRVRAAIADAVQPSDPSE